MWQLYYILRKIIYNEPKLFSGSGNGMIDSKYLLLKKSEFHKYQFIRSCYENFFLKYFRKEKRNLKHNIQQKFDDFIYELTLHEIFYNLKYCIGIHKGNFQGNTKPDFQLRKLFKKLYAEAKNVYDIKPVEKARLKNEELIFNSINNIESSFFYLKLWKLQAKSTTQTSAKPILSLIKTEIKKWPRNKLSSFQSQELRYENNEIIFQGFLELRDKSKWNKPRDSFVGTRMHNTIFGNTKDSIVTAFKKKAGKYGNIEKPFILCLNILSSRGFDLLDIENALYGQSVAHISFNNAPDKISRHKDGVFTDPKKSYSRVSGVLVSAIDSLSLFDSEYCYFVNPNAKNKFFFKELKTATLEKDGITVKYTDGLNFNQLIRKKYTPIK